MNIPYSSRRFAILAVLLTIATSVAASNAVSVASPLTCTSVHDCPKTSYCKNTESVPTFESRDSRYKERAFCTKRLGAGSKCSPTDPFACKPGLYCAPAPNPIACKPGFYCTPAPKPIDATCVALPVSGAACDTRLSEACAKGLRCTADGKCRAQASTGGVGTPCRSDYNCAIENGLACNLFTGKCVKRKPLNSPCVTQSFRFTNLPDRIRSQDCLGYCRPGGKDARLGTCDGLRGVGGKCNSDVMCLNQNQVPTYSENPRRCNHGQCMPEQTLIKQLGANCDRTFDQCDERRALKCMWSPERKRTVCQQRGPEKSFCTPGSPFSQCDGRGRDKKPLECRESRKGSGFFTPTDFRYFVCLQQSRPVMLGGLCVHDIDKCPAGSACRKVPYYRYANSRRARFVNHYACMELLPANADCTKNRLTSMCGDGLICTAGRCVKGKIGIQSNFIRAGLYSDCSAKLLCAPGLVCSKGDGGTFCEFVTTKVGLGDICGSEARKSCKEGLQCSYGDDPKCVKKAS